MSDLMIHEFRERAERGLDVPDVAEIQRRGRALRRRRAAAVVGGLALVLLTGGVAGLTSDRTDEHDAGRPGRPHPARDLGERSEHHVAGRRGGPPAGAVGGQVRPRHGPVHGPGPGLGVVGHRGRHARVRRATERVPRGGLLPAGRHCPARAVCGQPVAGPRHRQRPADRQRGPAGRHGEVVGAARTSCRRQPSAPPRSTCSWRPSSGAPSTAATRPSCVACSTASPPIPAGAVATCWTCGTSWCRARSPSRCSWPAGTSTAATSPTPR